MKKGKVSDKRTRVGTRFFYERLLAVLVVSVTGLGWFSCSESHQANPDTLGYDYYPLKIGQYRIYEVQEIAYQIIGFDTSTYQLRETIIDSIPSNDQTIYLLRRDIRDDELAVWENDSLWTLIRTPTYLSITENNIPLIKLTFPVKTDRQWDGNSLNSRNVHTYRYQNLNTPVVDSISAGDHVRVIIEDIPENVTGVDMKSEVYARGIGLVEKDYLTQKKCTSSDCGDDLGKVIAGRSLRQTLIEIGNEQ